MPLSIILTPQPHKNRDLYISADSTVFKLNLRLIRPRPNNTVTSQASQLWVSRLNLPPLSKSPIPLNLITKGGLMS